MTGVQTCALPIFDKFNELGIFVGSVVITQYAGQAAADAFRKQLDKSGIASYLHYPIKGYPTDMDHIISPEGMGKNDYIKTSRNLVVVTAPGPVLVSWQRVCPICTMTN